MSDHMDITRLVIAHSELEPTIVPPYTVGSIEPKLSAHCGVVSTSSSTLATVCLLHSLTRGCCSRCCVGLLPGGRWSCASCLVPPVWSAGTAGGRADSSNSRGSCTLNSLRTRTRPKSLMYVCMDALWTASLKISVDKVQIHRCAFTAVTCR